MSRFATQQQFQALFPTVATGKAPATVAQLLSLASGEVEQVCNRRFTLTMVVEQITVESGQSSAPAVGALGFTDSLPLFYAAAYAPTTIFLRNMPVAEVDSVLLRYPGGGTGGQIDLTNALVVGQEGWLQLPPGVYCPEYTVAQVQYWSGFPQTEIATTAALAGDTTLHVLDARGIVIGSQLRLIEYERDEDVSIMAQPVPGSGPATLTLASPLRYAHALGTPVWGTPETLTVATCYLVADYLTTGTWPTNVPGGAQMVKSGDITMQMRGSSVSTGHSSRGPLANAAFEMLHSAGLVRVGM